MRTQLAECATRRPESAEINQILRKCVHCGFCNAACPTYRLTGNELDGPRGRIYLLKQLFEGQPVSNSTQQHLDRCLSCRACETACPSGVTYSRLLDIGREVIEPKVTRKLVDRLFRQLIMNTLAYRRRFRVLLAVAQLLRPLLPEQQKKRIPPTTPNKAWPQSKHARRMLILQGCVQNVAAPEIDRAAAEILDNLDVCLIAVNASVCCGALHYHMAERKQAEHFAKQNIDACWQQLEQGAEAVIATASACALMLKGYRQLLQHDVEYAEKARFFSEKVKDISEVISTENLQAFSKKRTSTIALQAPCTLQHGLGQTGTVENILQQVGYKLLPVANGQQCCGSAGAYSLMQPELSQQLQQQKINDLQQSKADCIATANIGCLLHLQAGSHIPVTHWIQLLL